MALMQPQPSNQEPQQQPAGAAPQMSPQQPTTPSNVGTSEPDGGPLPDDSGQNQDQDQGNGQNNQIVQALQQHLDQLPDQDKAFLSAHLTPEFVRAIGLINGPEVAGYLNQFADPNKVLIPVPRDEATKYLQRMQQQRGQQPQGQPQPAQQQPQARPMMQPQQMPQQPPQQLPNGVTPAPMQHGIMAPRG